MKFGHGSCFLWFQSFSGTTSRSRSSFSLARIHSAHSPGVMPWQNGTLIGATNPANASSRIGPSSTSPIGTSRSSTVTGTPFSAHDSSVYLSVARYE